MDVREAKELKKCPFCGGEAILKINHGFHKEVVSAFAYCKECGVATRSYALKATAVEAWNRRTMSTNVIEKILEEIEEATSQEDAPIYLGDMEVDGYVRESRVKEIICSHMADVPDADNDWIPVEERLPEDNPDSDYYESVIVTLLDGRCAPGVYRNGDKEWWVEAEDGGKKYTFESDVIAWRPLPEPYKQN